MCYNFSNHNTESKRIIILQVKTMAKLWRKPFDAEIKATKCGRVTIDRDKCKGCSYCTEFCPRGALEMSQEINAKGYTLAAVSD